MNIVTAIFLSIIAFFQGLFRVPVTKSTAIVQGASSPIKIKATNQTLTAISMRLTYSYSGGNVELLDSDPGKDGVQIKIDPEMPKNGWSYPVNKVTQNGQNITVDLALVNLNPGGGIVNGELTLGTLNFKGDASSIKFSESFDKSLTKFINKNNEEKKVNLDNGELIIN